MAVRTNIESISKDEINSAYKDVFESPKGQVVLLHMASIRHLNKSTFDSDPLIMARKEGERRSILDILERINASIIDIVTDVNEFNTIMMEEQNNDTNEFITD